MMLSGLVVVNVASKCVPSFLSSSHGHWVKFLDAGIGVIQGVHSGVILPRCASRARDTKVLGN